VFEIERKKTIEFQARIISKSPLKPRSKLPVKLKETWKLCWFNKIENTKDIILNHKGTKMGKDGGD